MTIRDSQETSVYFERWYLFALKTQSMISYVSQIVETAQRLKGTGFEINEEWVGLAGLPEKFGSMKVAIEHSGIGVSTDVSKTKLLDMR